MRLGIQLQTLFLFACKHLVNGQVCPEPWEVMLTCREIYHMLKKMNDFTSKIIIVTSARQEGPRCPCGAFPHPCSVARLEILLRAIR